MSQTLVPEIDLGYWKGWINLPAATRVSATSLTLPGDFTSIFDAGDKLMLTDTTVKYFYILSPVTFSAGVTTLTITGGSDYSLVGTGAGALTSVNFSKSVNPHGFPGYFNLASTGQVGWSSLTTSNYKFQINGRIVTVMLDYDGTSNSATTTIPLPVAASSTSDVRISAPVMDNGAWLTTPGQVLVTANATAFTIGKTAGTANNFTASGEKAIGISLNYPI